MAAMRETPSATRKENQAMKYYDASYTAMKNRQTKWELRKARDMAEPTRRRMLTVNRNARLATVFGATFVM